MSDAEHLPRKLLLPELHLPAKGLFVSLALGVLQFFTDLRTHEYRGLAMSYFIHEPKLCKVNNQTEEKRL